MYLFIYLSIYYKCSVDYFIFDTETNIMNDNVKYILSVLLGRKVRHTSIAKDDD